MAESRRIDNQDESWWGQELEPDAVGKQSHPEGEADENRRGWKRKRQRREKRTKADDWSDRG